MAETHIALLRGINVGGKHKLPMKDLRELFEGAGCASVRTYIQSGNVVFEAGARLAARIEAELPGAIEERFGFGVPVVLRTGDELREVVASNPFNDGVNDPAHLHVGFLLARPDADAVAGLDPERSAVDSFAVVGKEVYFHVPGGMARTKLTTDYFDRRLGTVMTGRSWRTVNRLLEMVEGG